MSTLSNHKSGESLLSSTRASGESLLSIPLNKNLKELFFQNLSSEELAQRVISYSGEFSSLSLRESVISILRWNYTLSFIEENIESVAKVLSLPHFYIIEKEKEWILSFIKLIKHINYQIFADNEGPGLHSFTKNEGPSTTQKRFLSNLKVFVLLNEEHSLPLTRIEEGDSLPLPSLNVKEISSLSTEESSNFCVMYPEITLSLIRECTNYFKKKIPF